MAIVSPSQLASALSAAGFPTSAIPTGIAVAYGESGADTTATNHNSNGSIDYGVWQINSVHSDLLARYKWNDLNDNAKMAYAVWHGAGDKWTPWMAFTNGSYKKFANKAVGVTASDSPAGIGPSTGEVVAAGGVDTTAQQDALSNINGFFAALSSAQTWQRIAIALCGVLLVIAGLIIVFRRPIGDVATVAAKVAL